MEAHTKMPRLGICIARVLAITAIEGISFTMKVLGVSTYSGLGGIKFACRCLLAYSGTL